MVKTTTDFIDVYLMEEKKKKKKEEQKPIFF